MATTRVFLPTALLLTLLLLPVPAGEDTPSFEDQALAESFTRARSLFEEGEFKEARKLFQACRKGAAKDDKKLIKNWLKACEGGKKLGKVEKSIAKARWKAAHGSLTKLRAAYGATPLGPRLDELMSQVEGMLYTLLATFEDPPPEPEKRVEWRPRSAQVNSDARFVKGGERSLEWSAEVDMMRNPIAFLPLARIDGATVEAHRILHFSIYSPDDRLGKFTIFFDVGNLDELREMRDPTRLLRTRGFFFHLTVNRVGWTDFQVDLRKQLQTYSNPTREEIEGLNLLMVPPSKPKKIYIDDVRLEK